MSDEQDRAEALDADKIDADYPPDEPMGVDEPEVTPRGEEVQESFEERTWRHEAPGEDDGQDRPVVQPYPEGSEDVTDDEAQAVAEAEIDGRDPEADGAPPPAEETAVHLDGEP